MWSRDFGDKCSLTINTPYANSHGGYVFIGFEVAVSWVRRSRDGVITVSAQLGVVEFILDFYT